MDRRFLFAVIAALLMVISGNGLAHSAGQQSPFRTPIPFASKIDHVVIIMMENHAYDNYFETYCLQLSAYCNETGNGIAPGTCEPMLGVPGGCVVPYAFNGKNLSPPDLPHTYNSTIEALNGGQMNNFYVAERKGLEPFGYYNGTTVPVYWDLAQEFGLGDDFFSAALSYSLPNHWYLLSGQAPAESIGTVLAAANYSQKHTYLNESNATPSIQNLLVKNGLSFRYYDFPLAPYQTAIQAAPRASNDGGKGSAYSYWNPLAAKAQSYNDSYSSAFVARDQIFSDLQDSNLPNVSYVLPCCDYSDHPPANRTLAEEFVANVVDSIEYSPYWNHTAIFLTWDEYGGWYDNVAPPSIDSLGLSFRVPLIVISPYTPRGEIIGTLGHFESTLAFIEDRWGLQSQCMTPRDCGAPNLGNYFDFNMTPRSPAFIDPNPAGDTYPYEYEPYNASELDTTWLGVDNPAIDEDTD
jgi:phospholipase C